MAPPSGGAATSAIRTVDVMLLPAVGGVRADERVAAAPGVTADPKVLFRLKLLFSNHDTDLPESERRRDVHESCLVKHSRD